MIISNVQAVMMERGMTFYELERKTGLPEQRIVEARTNIGECRLITLAAIAQALEVDLKDLFDEKK